MRARLVGGPFNGKVVDWTGSNMLVYRGPKKMTRKQKWEHAKKNYAAFNYPVPFPHVEARYVVAMHPDHPALMAKHPDGSVFFKFVEGSKREL